MDINDRMIIDLHEFVDTYSTGISRNDFCALQESSQIALSDKVLDKIFDSMMDKYTKIDFGEIPASKGDLVTFKHYDNLNACITILLDIAKHVKDFPEATILKDTRDNLIKLSHLFKKGYQAKNSYVIIVYNTIVMSLFEGTSAIISAMVDYVKTDEGYVVSLSSYRGSGQMILLNSLISFNKTVKDGTMIKYLNEALSNREQHAQMHVQHESVLAAGAAVAGLKALGTAAMAGMTLMTWGKIAGIVWVGSKIIPLTKELIYLFYATVNKISDAATVQAEFLETNISILTDRGENPKIISRQTKIVEIFKRTARLFAVNHEKAEHKATIENKDDTNINPDDIII